MFLAYTICSENYLPYAKSMGDSLIKHNPAYAFFIFVFNKKNHTPPALRQAQSPENFFPHKLIDIDSIALPYYQELRTRYNDFELSCALKPFIAEYILDDAPDGTLLFYFDSDMLLFGSLSSAENALNNHSILISPHILSGFDDSNGYPKEETLLSAGVYNAGFWGVSKEDESIRFIKWWQEKLKYKCFVKLDEGLFVDQVWLSFVPIFFEKTIIFRDPGYNVAYWNLHERSIKKSNNVFIVNNTSPLILFHYSGFNIFSPEQISKHQNRFSFSTLPDLKPIYDTYITNAKLNDTESMLKDSSKQNNEGVKKNESRNWYNSIKSFFRK